MAWAKEIGSEDDDTDEIVSSLAHGDGFIFAGGRYGGPTFFGTTLTPVVAADNAKHRGIVLCMPSQQQMTPLWS